MKLKQVMDYYTDQTVFIQSDIDMYMNDDCIVAFEEVSDNKVLNKLFEVNNYNITAKAYSVVFKGKRKIREAFLYAAVGYDGEITMQFRSSLGYYSGIKAAKKLSLPKMIVKDGALFDKYLRQKTLEALKEVN